MKHYSTVLLSSIFIILSACTTPSHVDYETRFDFSSYDQFSWADHKVQNTETYDAFGGDIFESRLQRSVEKVLEFKGMTPSDAPDFLIDYSLIKEQRAVVRNDNFFGDHRHWWYSPYHWHRAHNHVNQIRYYDLGTLTLKVKDAITGKTVWTSTVKKVLTKPKSPEVAEAKLYEQMSEMLASFPPNNVLTL